MSGSGGEFTESPVNSQDQDLERQSDKLIEIGVVISGQLDTVDRRAVSRAINQLHELLPDLYSDFRFAVFPLSRPETINQGYVEPSLLLQQAVEERDNKRWDFAFVVTAAELVSVYSCYSFAALSRQLDAAVISLASIDPRAVGVDVDDQQRIECIADRLRVLVMHALGHLNGAGPSEDPASYLHHPEQLEDLDRMDRLSPDEIAKQRLALEEIADQRLEEDSSGKRLPALNFLSRAAWINRREIFEAVVASRPWQFPRRLSRLTIAAVSTFAILYITAEAWDLALTQDGWHVLVAVLLTVLIATFHVITTQQLLLRRGRYRSEQNVVTSSSAFLIVLCGMLTTWFALFMLGIIVGGLLFSPSVITHWAASAGLSPGDVTIGSRMQMASFTASVGLLIGALGASFESQHYFRHVILVDEEI